MKSVTEKITCPLHGTRRGAGGGSPPIPPPPEAGRVGDQGAQRRGRSCPAVLAPNLCISVPLGLPALQSLLPPRPRGLAPPARAECGGGGLRAPPAPSSPHLPGLTPSSSGASPLLPPPRYSPSKSSHRRQLQGEADAGQRGRRRSGSWAGGTGGGTRAGGRAGGRAARSLSLPLPRSRAAPPAPARGPRRSEAAPRGWPQPQVCSSLPPPLPPCSPTTSEFASSARVVSISLRLSLGKRRGAGSLRGCRGEAPAKSARLRYASSVIKKKKRKRKTRKPSGRGAATEEETDRGRDDREADPWLFGDALASLWNTF